MMVPVGQATPGMFERPNVQLGTTPTLTPRPVGCRMHTKVRSSPIGPPVLLPALVIFMEYGGVAHASRSSRVIGSVNPSILVYHWFALQPLQVLIMDSQSCALVAYICDVVSL